MLIVPETSLKGYNQSMSTLTLRTNVSLMQPPQMIASTIQAMTETYVVNGTGLLTTEVSECDNKCTTTVNVSQPVQQSHYTVSVSAGNCLCLGQTEDSEAFGMCSSSITKIVCQLNRVVIPYSQGFMVIEMSRA